MSVRAAKISVPREAAAALKGFVELLIAWNRRLNLLSRGETADIWTRHVYDSAQLFRLAPASTKTWLDLGSGAGFPGLVCAAVARAEDRAIEFTLVEADGRKAAFLREAARRLDVDVVVLRRRIEELSLAPQSLISARALAPLGRLLDYAAPFSHEGTVLLLPKGRQADSELTLARRDWHIRAVRIPSRTDPEATILRLSEVIRRR